MTTALDVARRIAAGLLVAVVALAATFTHTFAQCPAKPPIQNWDSANRTACLCFIPGEQAGVTFTAPAGDYPLEILSVGIYWTSANAPIPNPSVIEQAIHAYAGGLPNPGAPVATIAGPTLLDLQMNTFVFPTPVAINSGPFTLTLEFQNTSSPPFGSGIAEDGPAGCRAGRNVVFSAATWSDACVLGVPGDWVMEVTYRPCLSTVPTEESTWGGLKVLYGD